MSILRSVIYPYTSEILIKPWAAMAFTFQWEKLKEDYFGPDLICKSLQQYNKILIHSKKSQKSQYR